MRATMARRMQSTVRGMLGGGAAVVGGAALLRPGTPLNRLLCSRLDDAARQLRFAGGRLEGMSYRLRGRHPDPDVPDTVLADRIRSSLGPLEKRLDLPHVHVMVEDHVALLHGEVVHDSDAHRLERAVAAVSGVRGVESYLHVGLVPGDTRPSTGRAHPAVSPGLRHLLDAAVEAGATPETARSVLGGILGVLADRLPPPVRSQVASHLPADVRPLFRPPRRTTQGPAARTVDDLVRRVAAVAADVPPERARQVTVAVIDTLRGLVSDEAADVAAVLPDELRRLWHGQVRS